MFTSVCVRKGEGELKTNPTRKGQGGRCSRRKEGGRDKGRGRWREGCVHTHTHKSYTHTHTHTHTHTPVNAINQSSRGAQVTKESRREHVNLRPVLPDTIWLDLNGDAL